MKLLVTEVLSVFSYVRTLLEFASSTAVVTSGAAAVFQAVARFSLMFFGSAAVGVLFGLLSAMVSLQFHLNCFLHLTYFSCCG